MTMIVAGVVIETAAGAAPRVAARLVAAGLMGRALELRGGDGDSRLAAVFTADDGHALEALAERLLHDDDEVLGVFPTFVADER